MYGCIEVWQESRLWWARSDSCLSSPLLASRQKRWVGEIGTILGNQDGQESLWGHCGPYKFVFYQVLPARK